MSRRSMLALTLMTLFVMLAIPAFATKRMANDFKTKYPNAKNLARNSECAQCHEGTNTRRPGKLNAYGKDFKAQKGKNAEKYAKIENLDSDKDGFTNLEEIKAGSNPGEAKVTPKTVSSNTRTTATTAMQPAKTPATPKAGSEAKAAPKQATPVQAAKK